MFLLLFLSLPAQAHPQVLVIFADHLTLDDVTRPDLPNFTRMRQEGDIALMSPGLAQKPDPVANVYATLGAGDTVRVGDVSQGRLGETLRRAGFRTALIGDADGDDTGPYQPARLFLPQPDVTADGTIAAPTVPGGKRMDPANLWAATQAAFKTCNLVVVHFGDFARAERENQRGFLLPAAYKAHRQRTLSALDSYLGMALRNQAEPLFLIVPTPPLQPDGTWNRLTPFLACNVKRGREIGSAAQSETTQTWGLVAARDAAPTILIALNAPPPIQMTGAVIERAGMVPDEEVLPGLRRMDRLTQLNQEAQNAIFWTVGVAAVVIVFGSLSLYLTRRMTGRRGQFARYGLRLVSVWPLALLIAPLANPHTVNLYLLEISALVGLLALLPSPPLICALTAVVLVVDGLTGTTLISNSALSEYALSGIRFYGIGNEYMGVLLGGALLMCLRFSAEEPNPAASGDPSLRRKGKDKHELSPLAPQNWGGGGPPSLPSPPSFLGKGAGGLGSPAGGVVLVLWFTLVIFVLSFPAFGAKAGGAITATALFYIAWRRLTGRPVSWMHLLGSIVAGFALVILWGVLSHELHLRRTHLETATEALGQGRFGYIRGISLRKMGLAARVILHPGTTLGLLAFAALGLTARKLLRRQVTDYLARNSRFAAVWRAGLWGCLVAVLFNDSGIVAAILVLQCLVLTLLHGLYGEGRDAPARA